MKKITVVLLGCLLIIAFQFCNNQKDNAQNSKSDTATTNVQGLEKMSSTSITPVPLPNPNIPGFTFPEDSAVINTWLKNNDSAKIVQHGWGLWTALNMNSGQQYNNEQLRIFETWFTPADISSAMSAQQNDKAFTLEKLQRGGRSKLSVPKQLIHDREMKSLNLEATIPADDSSRILGFVKFDPSAASFAITNKLFDGAVLQAMLSSGKTDIPPFPASGMTLKPVFEIITKANLVGGYFNLKVWNGPPGTPIAYPENKWPGCVYVDINNKGQGNGTIDIGCKGRTPQTTYNVNDFIHFTLDKQAAAELKSTNNISASEGDVAILVAMHATTREITRWTWQTYWWTPDPNMPPFPSSQYIASKRPQQLVGAASHYAMSIAYTFITPDQPLTGGNNVGKSLYAFNPYLEARFSPATFYDVATVVTNGKTITNKVGVQTNCMSCHALANFNPNQIPTGPGYMANTYIDMQGARFNGVLKTDFSWAIPDNASSNSTNFSLLLKKKKDLNK
jgi:hypothetical protein